VNSSKSVAGSETILVVEDEAVLQDLITLVLERLGYTVLAVGSADAALPLLEKADRPLDILLTDVVLPGRLKANELAHAAGVLWPQLRVLYMSGYARDTIVQSGRLDEGINYLEKPFTPEGLALRVREVLDSPPSSG
jgi:CheY-like chemotaxis protein